MNLRKITFIWLGSIVFAAAAVFIVVGFGLSDVRVFLVNQAGQTIEEITIMPETRLGEKVIVAGLKDGETEEVVFPAAESAYKLSVKLPDGSIDDSDTYVEGGYTVTHRIRQDGIETGIETNRTMISGIVGLGSVAVVVLTTIIYFLILLVKLFIGVKNTLFRKPKTQ